MNSTLHRTIVAVAITLVPLLADWSGVLRPIENQFSTFRMAVHRIPPTGEIVVVDIDTKSINEVGSWPWSRRLYAELVDKLWALGAAEIAIDVDFSAPSTPDNDAILEDALKRADGAVILPTFVQSATGAADAKLSYNRPISRLAANSWLASVNVRQDNDGIVRRFGTGLVLDGELIPSMSVVLAGVVAEVGKELLIDFSIDMDAVERISVIDVLRGSADRARIAGKKVIVGAQAVELRDFFNVPVAGTISGAMLQVAAAETMLQGRVLRETSLFITLLGLIVLAFGAAAIGRQKWSWMLSALLATALVVEISAIILQARLAIVMVTAPWHLAFAVFAVAVLLCEIDLRRLLQIVWRRRAVNAEALLTQVVADNFAGIVVIDERGIVRAASRTAAELLGQQRELVGHNARAILPSELVAAVEAVLKVPGYDRFARRTNVVTHIRHDGSHHTFEYVITISDREAKRANDDGAGRAERIACLTFTDVTERLAAAERIHRMAHFDALTGLPNRNRLIERLEEIFTSPDGGIRASAIVCFDLDRFKNVNDTLGHHIGDLLLISVAARATALLPPGALLARLGGDEFSTVFSGRAAAHDATEFATNLVATVGRPFHLAGHHVMIGASAGVALADSLDKGPDDILKRGDVALYRAKSNGGGGIAVFEREMLSAIVERQLLEDELWKALERKEFEVWYQPQIDLRSEEVAGVEALVRWRHPARGLVPPSEFIPVAEAVGLINELGRWVLETACAEAVNWPGSIRLAVNVSSAQFARGNIAEVVERALLQTTLDPSRLDLEITESLFIQPTKTVHTVLSRLRSMGVGIALDDFGTGYSSLSYLQRFPITKIKLDQSFVGDLPENASSAAIVRAVARLAKDLGLHLNAEGVENAAQVAFLTTLGIDEAQGFFYGRPQPSNEIARLFKNPHEVVLLRA